MTIHYFDWEAYCLSLPACAVTPPEGVQGLPLGMSKIRSEYLAPELSAAAVWLRQEPDEEEEEEEDDDGEEDGGEEDGGDNEDGDEGYSP
jgi:hypothetical protein